MVHGGLLLHITHTTDLPAASFPQCEGCVELVPRPKKTRFSGGALLSGAPCCGRAARSNLCSRSGQTQRHFSLTPASAVPSSGSPAVGTEVTDSCLRAFSAAKLLEISLNFPAFSCKFTVIFTNTRCTRDENISDRKVSGQGMRIVSWNVNGLRAVLKNSGKNLRGFLDSLEADIICLQETKAASGCVCIN